MKKIALIVALLSSSAFCMDVDTEKKENLSVTVSFIDAASCKITSSVNIVISDSCSIGQLIQAYAKYKKRPQLNNIGAVQHLYQITEETETLSHETIVSTIPGVEKWGVQLFFKKEKNDSAQK